MLPLCDHRNQSHHKDPSTKGEEKTKKKNFEETSEEGE